MAEETQSPAAAPAVRVPHISSQQVGLWFIHRADPGCAAYHLVFSARITEDGGLAAKAAGVLADLVREHEALRICFRPGPEGGPEQWVQDSVPLDVETHEARGLGADELNARIRADSRVPFDLGRPPLWRVRLYRTGAREWVLTVVMHHIAFDFWSLALLLTEARRRLEVTPGTAGTAGTPGAAEIDGSAFRAYAERQDAFLESPEARALLAAETARLADAPPSLDLHGDLPRPPEPSHEGGSAAFSLSAAASEAVRRLARETASTPYMALLAAYVVFLGRLSGRRDVLVGTPTSGRLQRRFRNALGNFVNTVVVRGEADEEATYRQLVAAAKERALDAMRGQEIPFPRLVKELALPRDPSRTPLYQAGFAWDRLPLSPELGQFFLLEPDLGTEVRIAGAVLRPHPLPQQEGQADLWVEMGGERDGGYVGVLRFTTDVFTAETGRELAAAFAATVETLAARPDEPVRTLPRGDAGQLARLNAWGTGPRRELPEDTLPGLLRAQARRTPQATALVADGEEWSYGRLLGAVRAVAGALRAAGVRRGDRVGVPADRGAPLVAALLGVLEAGAAYVPLDPQLPADRLGYMAEDSGARLLLTQESLRSAVPGGLPVLCLEEVLGGARGGAGGTGEGAGTAGAGEGAPWDGEPAPVTPADLAYVLYTSGSTGRPKGVAIPHGALVNLLLAMRDDTGFSADDAMLAVTTVSFDIAGLELYLPLVAGGRVLLCDSATAADGAALAARIADSGATWMQATPTSWRMLREAGWAGHPGLNVLCGGEELPRELAEFLAPRVASLRNVYGPTETTIWSTSGRVAAGRGVDIGAPIANTLLYVLDEYGRRVEPAFPGELYIGGDGLALGYWDRPELTAERFVTGLPAAPEQRLYRTGDRARWTGDGRLLHLGRLDNQVKLRGYRIELAEVEAVLQAAEGVSAAVVVVREDRLVAYVVAEPGAEPKPAELRALAARSLPPYMVPGLVVPLAELPLTANKKVDRKRLPAPKDAGLDRSAPFEKPRDATEITLARMWTELLDLPEVGVHDDFFEVGGHSLLAVRLAAAIRAEWDVDIPVATLLRHGTIAELATVVRQGGQEAARGPMVTLRRADGGRPLFLFHPFGGTVFCYVELARHLPPGRPVMAVQAPGLDAEGEAEVSVEEMAARYLGHLREVQPEGPYALGGWCFGGVIAFEAARRLREAGEEVDLLVAIDSRAPIPENIPESADDATLLSWFARDLAVPYGKELDIPADELRALGGDAAFDHILARAAAAGVLPEDADRAQVLRYFEAYLANGIALQTYLPEPADVDLLLLRAVDEPADYGPALGWDGLVKGALRIVDVPGDHNSVMYPPHAAVAAGAIAPHLPGPPGEARQAGGGAGSAPEGAGSAPEGREEPRQAPEAPEGTQRDDERR
ncbi:non-ribosomal peptide synthetase [Streptomyces hoynatensis]|uniref:Non-ribosomal peptide synthetase n=1 Tax=Streptomyces hoynatensis TaxID=1141874 RepID=A0A3A9YWJ6_9ACTN|nr:non-ribosomal peptide synthetase [Streptomyces hoynatensis]RKN40378.1 non-ribosomal peptide synthetase [Streptomyces hoynatensis]